MVTLTVQRAEFPNQYVSVEATVVQADPPTASQVLALSRRYLPPDQAQWFARSDLDRPAGQFTCFTVLPDRWLGFDVGGEG